MVPVAGDEGSSSVCSKGPSQLAASFSFDTCIRTDRRMVVNFATRKERRWRFRVVAMVGEAFPVKVGSVSPPRSSVPRVSAQRRR
jgi:hypothetical protein